MTLHSAPAPPFEPPADDFAPLPAGAIAIVGLGCRFPGCPDVEAFWELLAEGREAIRFFTPEELAAAGVDPVWRGHPSYVPAGAVLDDIESFDAELFGLTAREAAVLDPQHRLLLECAWEALESAGWPPRGAAGSVGVYAGSRISEYLLFHQGAPDLAGLTPGSPVAHVQALTGNDKDYLPPRLSHALDLRGPSIAVQTACSTSLVAVHLACQALLARECDLALAGGVSVRVPQQAGYVHTEGMIFSPDGHTRPFDAEAAGTVFGSGAGMVALRRLEDALAAGEPIRAVLLGSAVNNDGATGKAGFTAPSARGQAAVIAEALAVAGVEPETVSYVEAHGTGTALGDPVEVAALADAFAGAPAGGCALGTVKSNFGHLVQAAGIAGLIKTVLMLERRTLVPSLHFRRPNPQIDFARTPFAVNTARRPWPAGPTRRRAGVSSFGMGGTNAHVVLEEAGSAGFQPAASPDRKESRQDAGAPSEESHFELVPCLLALSAQSPPALAALARRFARHLTLHPEVPLADVCRTAGVGRLHLAERLAVVGATPAELACRLEELAAGEAGPGAARGTVALQNSPPKIAYLYTGQGAPRAESAGAGRWLFAHEAVFRRAFERCDELFRPHLGRSLRAALAPESAAFERLDETGFAQPMLFTLQIALTELWRSWGVAPAAVAGHSVGDYAAACAAGSLALEDAALLVAHRARLMQELPPGAMATVFAPEDRVAAAILAGGEPAVAIAALNGPENTVVSGAPEAVAALCARLQAEGVRSRALPVTRAFHSPLMEPILVPFEAIARGTEAKATAPRLPWVSSLTGRPVEGAPDAASWRRQLREPVRFADGIAALHALGCTAFVEIGPGASALALGRRCLPEGAALWLPSLRAGVAEPRQLLHSLGELSVRGTAVDWQALCGDGPKVALPTYPFQRRRYWIERGIERPRPAQTGASDADGGHPLLGRRLASPLAQAQFEARVDPGTPAYLRDHRVHGRIVFPAVGFLEMALAAATALAGDGVERGPVEVAELAIREALFLSEGETLTLQTVVEPEDGGTRGLRIWARAADAAGSANSEDRWQLHVGARLKTAEPGRADRRIDPEALAAALGEVDIAAFYETWRQAGIAHGPTFRGLDRLWRGDREALVRVQATSVVLDDGGRHLLHPALLSGCIQVAEAAAPPPEAGAGAGDGVVYLPVVWERIRFHRPAGAAAAVWSHARLRAAEPGSDLRTVDLAVYDEAGEALLEVDGLLFKRAVPASLGVARDSDLLYQVEWRTAPPVAAVSTEDAASGAWLVLADRGGTGEALVRALVAQGGRARLVFAAGGGEIPEGALALDPVDPEAAGRLLDEGPDALRGVVHLWSLDAPAPTDGESALETAELLGCTSTLHLVQALVRPGRAPVPLTLVTRGAQTIGRDGPIAATQAPLWGLGRVVAGEHPALHCRLIDLDPADTAGAPEEAGLLLAEILGADAEDQVALRAGTRRVPRLVRATAPAAEPGPRPETWRLAIGHRGVLESLAARPTSRRTPGPGEVEIAVRAASLTFRDVLNALGHEAGAIDDEAGEVRFGFDCAGTVAALGPGVEGLAVGQEVMALAEGCLASHAVADARLVVPKPAGWSFAAAAALPVAAVTARLALDCSAAVGPGDRVLIHAAAGGVGLAAVHLARRAGAEVLATAGSEEKRDYLRSLGIACVLDSRTPAFVEGVRAATGGRGVDVVLNPLAGELAAASLAALAPGGRFVEIGGGADPQDGSAVRRFAPQLSRQMRDDPASVRPLLQEVAALAADRDLPAPPLQVFPLARAAEAFELMARARHIGKIVLDLTPKTAIRGDGTYLITGGLGGLGLALARWLVGQGARHLLLVGRGAPSAAAQEALAELGRTATVLVAAADVAVRSELERALAEARGTLPPLRGVFHLAGVLDDGPLTEQTRERFARVTAPKIRGAWNLHVLTAGMDLDLFVLYSSLGALFGPLRRGSYAAASAFLDALAQLRQARGLPALAVGWGSWAGLGMTAGDRRRFADLESAYGLGQLPAERALAVLGSLLSQALGRSPVPAQIGVAALDWPKYLRRYGDAVPPLFQELAREGGERRSARERPAAPRPAVSFNPGDGDLVEQIRGQVARVLGIAPAEVAAAESITRLGVDSLMSIELKHRIEVELGAEVPVVRFLEGPSVQQIAVLVAASRSSDAAVTAPAARTAPLSQAEAWEEGEL